MRIGLGVVAALGAFVFFMLVVGSLGGVRPELERIPVADVVAGASPADRYGNRELYVVGWYAELDADCAGSDGGADPSIAWLQRDCPLRVLLPYQPAEEVGQAELEANGLRLSASTGRPFPSRAEPGGPNIRLGQLVFVGHFDDGAAARCVPELADRCRNVFVVSDYDPLVR
ncbi:MAG TPA: hypothetical protein VEW45_00235 [Candidatus Dormibacteraeota bacterium]|nr:hypothetical protein [Candidatus Dormibacteraeota bacterium]